MHVDCAARGQAGAGIARQFKSGRPGPDGLTQHGTAPRTARAPRPARPWEACPSPWPPAAPRHTRRSVHYPRTTLFPMPYYLLTLGAGRVPPQRLRQLSVHTGGPQGHYRAGACFEGSGPKAFGAPASSLTVHIVGPDLLDQLATLERRQHLQQHSRAASRTSSTVSPLAPWPPFSVKPGFGRQLCGLHSAAGTPNSTSCARRETKGLGGAGSCPLGGILPALYIAATERDGGAPTLLFRQKCGVTEVWCGPNPFIPTAAGCRVFSPAWRGWPAPAGCPPL